MTKRLQWVLLKVAQRLLSAATLPQRSTVRPAAASAAELDSLRAGLLGEWVWVGSIDARGTVEKAELARRTTILAFYADGTMINEAHEGARMVNTRRDSYRFEGRNVVTTHPAFPVLRADAWSETELRLFWYRLSTTVVLARADAPADEKSPEAMVKRTSWRPIPFRGEA